MVTFNKIVEFVREEFLDDFIVWDGSCLNSQFEPCHFGFHSLKLTIDLTFALGFDKLLLSLGKLELQIVYFISIFTVGTVFWSQICLLKGRDNVSHGVCQGTADGFNQLVRLVFRLIYLHSINFIIFCSQ